MSKLFVHLSFCQYNGLWISNTISLQHLSFRFYSIVNNIITHLKQHSDDDGDDNDDSDDNSDISPHPAGLLDGC